VIVQPRDTFYTKMSGLTYIYSLRRRLRRKNWVVWLTSTTLNGKWIDIVAHCCNGTWKSITI